MSVDPRFVLQEPAAWALLTEKQRMVLKLYSRPTSEGRRRSVRGLCKGLGICHQAFYQTLRRAGVTLRKAAEAIESGA